MSEETKKDFCAISSSTFLMEEIQDRLNEMAVIATQIRVLEEIKNHVIRHGTPNLFVTTDLPLPRNKLGPFQAWWKETSRKFNERSFHAPGECSASPREESHPPGREIQFDTEISDTPSYLAPKKGDVEH